MRWLLLLLASSLLSAEPFFTLIEPPKGWRISNPSLYEKGVKITLIAPSKKGFTPSLTLSSEKVGEITYETYEHALKTLYRLDHFQKLGTFSSLAGTGHLYQIDRKSQWGEIRLLQGFILHRGYALILTGALLKSDFLKFLETYQAAFCSLQTFPSLLDSSHHPKLKEQINKTEKKWKSLLENASGSKAALFRSSTFQEEEWIPALKALKPASECWKFLALNHLKETLLSEED